MRFINLQESINSVDNFIYAKVKNLLLRILESK